MTIAFDLRVKLREGQPEGWKCDQRTSDVWCLTRWLDERFSCLDSERRRTLLWFFNRIVRSSDDVFEVAALVAKVGDEGLSIDEHAKDFWTAKRHNKWY